jgi:hypothetical protein
MGPGRYSRFARDWIFISDHSAVYHLWVDDSPNANLDHHIEMNRVIVETFAPQCATRGLRVASAAPQCDCSNKVFEKGQSGRADSSGVRAHPARGRYPGLFAK